MDRGRSRLTVLAIAYARFFLADVLEILESATTLTPLAGCTAGFYSKINNGATNFQTPVMDLSNIFGTSDTINDILKSTSSSDRLKFNRVNDESRNANLGYTMISQNNANVFVSGSPNSNVDHFSVFIHWRFVRLHTKFATMLGGHSSSNFAIFESARLFVVMVAETIARDLVTELGVLPVDYDFTQGIPSEFLLMPFMDRFPDVLPTYGDVPDRTNDLTMCSVPSRNYNTTLYSTSDLDTDVKGIEWVGYAAMYTSSRNGGFLTQSNRCNSQWYGTLSTSAFDPIAALIQRGRDHQFPSCESYRAMKQLPRASSVDFGNDAFSRALEQQYQGNFSNVDLSVCLLLDTDLRDRMMGSLILGVLNLQNSSKNCAGTTPALLGTPVETLSTQSFYLGAPVSDTNLEYIANAVCRSDPKLDLRALVMVDKLVLTQSASTLANLGPATDRFVVCTTADPFLGVQYSYRPSRSIIKEGNPANCDWGGRDPQNTGASGGRLLSNAPKCASSSDLTAWPQLGQSRRCYCTFRDNCFDRGVINPANPSNIICTCDAGFNRIMFANTQCERPSYTNTPKLYDQFAKFSTSPTPSMNCSSSYFDSSIPMAPFNASEADYFGFLNSYCTNPTCDDSEGPYLSGACNNLTAADAGRIGSAFGRIARPNYPNGKLYTASVNSSWTTAFAARYPLDSTQIPQNALFRGMGKLLLDDIFKASTTYFNESGLRTGSDAANPAQYKNLQTGWVDLSSMYVAPAPYNTTRFQDTLSIPFTRIPENPNGITDPGEYAMMLVFLSRHNALLDEFLRNSPCSGFTCDRREVARCSRIITIIEYQSIAREFLAEAKAMNLSADWNNARFAKLDSVVPAEVGAARLFDLHLDSDPIAACSLAAISPFSRNSLETCLTAAGPIRLKKQISPDTATLNNAINLVNSLGIHNLNAYLEKLGTLWNTLQPDGNILFDLHGSRAEYAFNFGILENILEQDAKANIEYARNACFNVLTAPFNEKNTWIAAVNFTINNAVNTTLCKVLRTQSTTQSIYQYGLPSTYAASLHPHMFRGDEPPTGSC